MVQRQTAVVYRLPQTVQNFALGRVAALSGEGAGEGSSAPSSSGSPAASSWLDATHGGGSTFLALAGSPAAQRFPPTGERAGDGSGEDSASSGTNTGRGGSMAERGVHGGGSSSSRCDPAPGSATLRLLGLAGAGACARGARESLKLRRRQPMLEIPSQDMLEARRLQSTGVGVAFVTTFASRRRWLVCPLEIVPAG